VALPLSNSFETGLADETALTIANSDDGAAGNAFDTVTGTVVLDSAQAAHGTLSARMDTTATAAAAVHWEGTAVGTVTEIYTRIYVYRTAVPAAQQRHMRIRNSSAADTCYSVIHTDGDVYIFDAAGGFSNMTTDLPLNQWVRLEYHLIAHATAGTWEVRMYSGDSATLLDSVSRSSVNTGSDISQVRMGSTTVVNAGVFWIDDVAAATTGWIGAVVSAQTLLPDADIVTTGWSTAPLFSKINDSSDATVISATAS
jgi:hypothetical protein